LPKINPEKGFTLLIAIITRTLISKEVKNGVLKVFGTFLLFNDNF
jgi:hypothetical protein